MSNVVDIELWAHPANPAVRVEAVRARLARTAPSMLALRYEIVAPSHAVSLPPPAMPGRADRLWETTCFELFLQPESGRGYRELNFSPSGQWAAYEFTGWRENMARTPLGVPPIIDLTVEPGRVVADIRLCIDLPDEPYALGLFAIVDERDGGRSFWAERHAGEEPDFHHPACFVHKLPPAPGA